MKEQSPELDYKFYGFTEADLQREFMINMADPQGIFRNQQKWKLGDLIKKLKEIYSGYIGLERGHITDSEASKWLINVMEVEPKDKAVLLKDKKVLFEGL